jgi:hypothetical protein
MNSLKQLLKDYGPALGPAVAFAFGLLALFLKNKVDQWTAHWNVSRRLRNLQHLVSASGPPETFFPQTSKVGIHADEARNLTNLARFYSRLLAVKPVFDALVEPISEVGNMQQIASFHAMKWWFDITLKQVESWRSTEGFRMSSSDLCSLQDDWAHVQDAATNPQEQLEYASRSVERGGRFLMRWLQYVPDEPRPDTKSYLTEQEANEMTVKERLSAAGLFEQFADALERRDVPELQRILGQIYLTSDDIQTVIAQMLGTLP